MSTDFFCALGEPLLRRTSVGLVETALRSRDVALDRRALSTELAARRLQDLQVCLRFLGGGDGDAPGAATTDHELALL
jgi:hypothetical protein